MIAQLENLPLEFAPGETWNYSVSIDVVGYLVEKLSGQAFGDFLRQRILQPLGMTDTTPDSATESIPDRTTFYFAVFSGDNHFGHEVARTVDYSCFAGAGAFLAQCGSE